MSVRDTNPTSAIADKKPPPESAKALAAYNLYESMGADRSYAKVAQKYAKSISYVNQIKRWADWYGWTARLREYEQTQLEARRKKRQDDLDRMDTEQAAVGHAYMVRALARIDKLLGSDVSMDFPASSAVSLLKISYELERLARGAITARSEISGVDGGPISVSGTVGFYPVLLPQKDAPPEIQIEQSDE